MIFQNKMFAMRFFTALLVSLLAGAEVDLFVPSFPELSRVFNLTPFMVQLTLSVNFMAYCICSLFTGALGDRYGRRPVIMASLLIFVVGSVLCVVAPNFSFLLVGRFFQGAGIAGPAVLGYLIVADECLPERKSSLLGLLNGMVTLAMAFAPVVGSYVTFYFHWRANFIVLLSLGLIALVAAIWAVPKREHDHSISLSPRTYLPILKSPQMWTFILSICFLAVPYWLFIGISPLLYMENLGVSLKEFGFYQGAIALVFSAFCLLSPQLLQWVGEKRCFYIGMIVCCMGAFFLMGVGIMGIRSPLLITLGMTLVAVGVVFPINILYPLCLDFLENTSGRSAALLLCIRLCLTAFLLESVSAFYDGKFFLISVVLFLMLIGALCLIQTLLTKKWAVLRE